MLVNTEDKISLLWVVPRSPSLSNILLFLPVVFVVGALVEGQTWHRDQPAVPQLQVKYLRMCICRLAILCCKLL